MILVGYDDPMFEGKTITMYAHQRFFRNQLAIGSPNKRSLNLELNSTRNNRNRSKIEQRGAFEFAASGNYMQRKRSSSVPIVVKKFVSIICNTRLYLHYTVHINVDGGQGVVFYNG